jgi:propanol-preferring alcohol dehydrogenase
MHAMTLHSPRSALVMEQRPDPLPAAGEVLVRVKACGVCRTDLHVVDGELPPGPLPIVPGHEVVGVVEALGEGVTSLQLGQRVGVPWLGHTCGHCRYCMAARENLCDAPQFTGYTRDGGYATHVLADANFAFALDDIALDDVALAPLLCAGLIGWRTPATRPRSASTASARPRTSSCRWRERKAAAYSRSRAPATPRRRTSRAGSAPRGPAAPMKRRPRRWMPR